MVYKALMLDVDGTLVPYDYAAKPSKRVIDAVKQAQKKVHVCLVTGRALESAKRVSGDLGLISGYFVLNGGAQVVDVETETVHYDRPIELSDARKIIDVLLREKIEFHIKQELHSLPNLKHPYKRNDPLRSPYMIFCEEKYSSEKIDRIFSELSRNSEITLHKARHKYPDKFGFNITHVKATKLHGLTIVCEKLGIDPQDTIGVGDGYNDFPLLLACGLKIAMGNAAEELKAIADFVAPSVDEDGVATVIEKFVLS